MRRSDVPARRLRVGILHAELGFGGAERLVLDAARCLQESGHQVTLFTTRHDQSRSFSEAAGGARDIEIRVYRPPWPSHIGQRLRAPCNILRMAYLAILAMSRSGPFDVLLCDQVPHIVPLLKRLTTAKIIFYCHFPDQLLPVRSSFRLYRQPIDRLETTGMAMADAVLVNSRFTASLVRQTFPHLSDASVHLVYPGVDLAQYVEGGCDTQKHSEILLLSLNRFKTEKNHELAIHTLSLLRQQLSGPVFASLRVVIAGGFDASIRDDRQTLARLQQLANDLGVASQVTLVQSCPESERIALLHRCRCLLYTPINEHFGFGPLEAMAVGRPVVAVESGGPLETVRDKETGFLCEPTGDAFAAAVTRLILDRQEAVRMGLAGRRHVEAHFSLDSFAERLNTVLATIVQPADDALRHPPD